MALIHKLILDDEQLKLLMSVARANDCSVQTYVNNLVVIHLNALKGPGSGKGEMEIQT